MIDRMYKYTFILPGGEKDNFIEGLRETGLVDITRGSKPVDERSTAMLSGMESVRKRIGELKRGSDDKLSSLISERKSIAAELQAAEPWGEFDLSRIEALGINLHLYEVRTKDFRPEWSDEYALQIVDESGGRIRFAVLGNAEGITAKETPIPKSSLSSLRSALKDKDDEIAAYSNVLAGSKADIPALEEQLRRQEADFSAYLAACEGNAAVEDSLVIFEGFAPVENSDALDVTFSGMEGVYVIREDATAEDRPPIRFRNNRFVSLFEPLTDMYGRPAYNGFDPTPFISVFFLLFFAMCMGDAGYGLILIIVGLLLRKVKGFAGLSPLVMVLGAGTVVVGLLFHTVFSVDLSQVEGIPEGIRKLFLPSKIAGYDGTMILAIAVGIVHLCLAMTVKAVYAVRNKGLVNSFGVLGWTLLLVGGAVVGAFALAGVMDRELTRTIIIILGIVSALGIFIFSDIHRNPLKNIGSGLWETYNTATGVLGDVLSYLRLYALGLAGSMLGFAFNDLAKMALGDGGLTGWIACILIVAVGHTLNIAMAALGAFVHPLRLNFLEFFKNSGYEAEGKKYNPIK
ncbi:MAG: hypothetical protein MJY50_03385 [Bacteroidales bacterium]|nr:hypothetical protein [Bacteroidales bacterium]